MSKSKHKRQLVVYKNYFKEFRKTLPPNALKKVYQILLYVITLEVIPSNYLKSITSAAGLYEIRIEECGNIYRIFCCFDEGNIVILFNGFQKKTQKTPINEIEKAKQIMKEYFDSKKGK